MNNIIEHSEIIDLRGVSALTALRVAVMLSEKTPEEISEGMDWSPSVSKLFFLSGSYHIPMDQLPRFCRVVGNTVIVDWLALNAGERKRTIRSMTPRTLLKDLSNVLQNAADEVKAGNDSIDDGVIEEHEVKRIIKCLKKSMKQEAKMLLEAEKLLSGMREKK